MPCNSDYMAQTDREYKLQKTATLYKYALEQKGLEVPKEVEETSIEYYANKDFVPSLCKLIRSFNDEEMEKIVYNARNKNSRDLADWWEEHEAADLTREEREREQKVRAEYKKTHRKIKIEFVLNVGEERKKEKIEQMVLDYLTQNTDFSIIIESV